MYELQHVSFSGHVFQVHTKVDLRFKPSEADWLHPDIRNRLIEQV